MEKKILTQEEVMRLGLNKVSVITAEMLDGYTSIGDNTFWGCSGLASIEIPNSVTYIGSFAFSGCSSLISVMIPNSVISIRRGAFSHCGNLTSVTIPNSVTSIGEMVFYGCAGLTSVTIPNSITSIGLAAFYGCRSLTSVTIGEKTYENQTTVDGKCKAAYKGFSSNLICRDFQYEEGKTYEYEGEPKLCVCGFHACLGLSDIFNYYSGEIGKDLIVYEVKLEEIGSERKIDSKVVAKKITIGKRIL